MLPPGIPEDRRQEILKTFADILAIPLAEKYNNYMPAFETEGVEDDDPLYYHAAMDYRVPVFEGSEDIAHVRLNIDQNTDDDHNYNLFIDIETPSGTEGYHMHLLKNLEHDCFHWANLYIGYTSNGDMYADLMEYAYMRLYPDCPVDRCSPCDDV
ncbi:hypothetical protein ATCV1_z005L [Acanthocystis turfacea chlorella virus 1]|uniref:Uncharacterized protein z005L n=1 Tax=Chlorovirus heliozoae TaxID=322019 RepID=A7K7W5_9PHYC|nr:hypothetical protein ATCV1_z005L [Acanthocystis turfacea chlorella virus 1]ABT16139.1 hypothetical protein ATCV1_z005L [Acanthocystis turfacea chlorella virus 1]AGE59952.1 hypothetical protein ATCVWI0606_008L [Acanthocystis turfacea Chlorella virus WI0606]